MSIQTDIDLPTHPPRSVPRIGLGVMPLSIAGRPDRASALAVIRHAVEEGIGLIDTADAYALDDSETGYGERLVADALREMGMSVHGGADAWSRNARTTAWSCWRILPSAGRGERRVWGRTMA